MRNGNPPLFNVFWLLHKSFYPTYEEWKLQTETFRYVIIITFYPTYEEWKRSIVHETLERFVDFLSYLWGMET